LGKEKQVWTEGVSWYDSAGGREGEVAKHLDGIGPPGGEEEKPVEKKKIFGGLGELFFLDRGLVRAGGRSTG